MLSFINSAITYCFGFVNVFLRALMQYIWCIGDGDLAAIADVWSYNTAAAACVSGSQKVLESIRNH